MPSKGEAQELVIPLAHGKAVSPGELPAELLKLPPDDYARLSRLHDTIVEI